MPDLLPALSTSIAALPLSPMAIVLLALYFWVLAVLSLYGVYRSYLLWRLKRLGVVQHLEAAEGRRLAQDEAWPRVTVQLPLFNERFVVERLLEAVARLEYPRERLEIQVLDDSTDETSVLVSQAVQRLKQQGLPLFHLHRTHREGFKAGALEEGLKSCTGELVAIFDADFVPPPDFLTKLVPLFRDAQVGMVQARWGHLNAEYSLLTRLQQTLLDAHFQIEHASRHASGHFFNFNGTAGIWRRACIEAAGGWEHDTLTEDLDLSYRAQLLGWKFQYVPEVVCPAELPVEMSAFKSQQRRWAKGAAQVGIKLLGRILRSDQPLGVKIDAWFHLTGSLSYGGLVVLALLMPATVWWRAELGMPLLWLDGPLFLLSMGSLFHFYYHAQKEVPGGWGRKLVQVLWVMGVGAGLALSNAVSVMEALMGRKTPFVRTAKHRIEGREGQVSGYRMAAGSLVWLEILIGFWFLAGIVTACSIHRWSSVPFLSIFAAGYLYVGLSSLRGRRMRASALVADVWSSIVRMK